MTSRSDRLNGYRHQHLLPFVFNAGVRFRLCYERLLPANLKDGNGSKAVGWEVRLLATCLAGHGALRCQLLRCALCVFVPQFSQQRAQLAAE
jgi:hypothetical protein